MHLFQIESGFLECNLITVKLQTHKKVICAGIKMCGNEKSVPGWDGGIQCTVRYTMYCTVKQDLGTQYIYSVTTTV